MVKQRWINRALFQKENQQYSFTPLSIETQLDSFKSGMHVMFSLAQKLVLAEDCLEVTNMQIIQGEYSL